MANLNQAFNTLQQTVLIVLQGGSVGCGVLRQNVAVCCSLFGFKFEGHLSLQNQKAHGKLESGYVAVWCSVLKWSSVRCSVLQHVAVCCSVLQPRL